MRQLFNRPGTHISVELLSAYLDNQVAPAERVRVEQHLHDCAACRAELTSLRQTVAVMQALPRVRVPRAFTLSEAKVGVRRSAAPSAWWGGLVRGLGAVTAVALVVVVAATALRPPAAAPEQAVARSAPAAAVVEKAAEAPLAPAAAAPAPMVVTESAPAPTAAADAEAPSLAMAQDATAAEPAPLEAAPAAALEAAPAARAVAPVPTETAEPAMLAMAPPAPPATEATAAPSTKAAGLGGGADPAAALPAEQIVPEPTPPPGVLAEVLSDDVRITYADLTGLWAIDGADGVRQLATDELLNTPIISSDGAYVVYRVVRADYVELWGVPWAEGPAELLLNERELPKDGLGVNYSERRIQDVRWIPNRLALALNIVRVSSPRAPQALPQFELWELDVETGALRQLAPLGRAYRPFFAPDGGQFALLEYGTEADPLGRLALLAADGSNLRTVLSFAASPAKLSYDDQVAWLPDSSALWLGVPLPDPAQPGQYNGTTLYRVTAAGQAAEAGFVDAYQVAWSPDGTRLASLRITSAMMEDGELYLADANGVRAQLYAPVKNGAFVAWSPDAAHFLYQDDYRMVLGAVGQPPQRLGTAVSFVNPRWVSETQFVSLHDTGTGWLLTLRGVDGSAYGLLELPREAMVDVSRP